MNKRGLQGGRREGGGLRDAIRPAPRTVAWFQAWFQAWYQAVVSGGGFRLYSASHNDAGNAKQRAFQDLLLLAFSRYKLKVG